MALLFLVFGVFGRIFLWVWVLLPHKDNDNEERGGLP